MRLPTILFQHTNSQHGLSATNPFQLHFISTCFINRTLKFHSLQQIFIKPSSLHSVLNFLKTSLAFSLVVKFLSTHQGPSIQKPSLNLADISNSFYFFQVANTLSWYYLVMPTIFCLTIMFLPKCV